MRRRMDQLRDGRDALLQPGARPADVRFPRAAWLLLSVPPSYLAETGAAVAKFPEVAYAYATTGPANLAACAVCRDEA